MNFDLQQAVALLKDLLWLKSIRASLTEDEKGKVDLLHAEILDAAFDDVERLMADWAKEVREHAERIIAAQEQAARDVVAEEERAAKEAIQEELDQAERQERSIAGVS